MARACAWPHTAWPCSACPRRRRPAVCIPKVVLYGAKGCHLCGRARATVVELRDELGFELEEIAIDGDPELEARYRELIPVVEIDGKQAFAYFVQPDALRRKVAQSAS
ncbi:MAG: glutaredoxin family protein [Actinomycetota bacterium]